MDKDFESIYHSAEDHNWWFRARQDLLYRFLKVKGYAPETRILDIGCGGGGLLSYLKERGFTKASGIDISPEAIQHCSSRGLQYVYLDDAQEVHTQKAGSYDIIIASDVLEHLERPTDALRRWRELLSDTGVLIVLVPAFKLLWSERDVLNHHITRYTKRELMSLARQVSLRPSMYSYWNFFMFIPYALVLRIKQHTPRKIVALNDTDTMLNKLLKKIMTVENTLILSGLHLPFGVSFIGIFKK
jgi:SAM-dependent methyltransferase